MRTTAILVGAIIEVDETIDLDPFIAVANELVTEICSDSGYSAERLELIERWLSAHFYTNRDPRASEEKAGPVSAVYQSKVDLNLSTSHYGQTAMTLDTKGGLAALNASIIKGRIKRALTVTWLGTSLQTTGDA
jgi:hypothetical protein